MCMLCMPLLQRKERDSLRNEDSIIIPEDIDYSTLSMLTHEERAKLGNARPRSVGAASRLPEIRASTLMLLAKLARQTRTTKAAS